MGSKGSTTQQTSSSSGPPPQVMAEYQGVVDRATNVANQPYQPYQGEMVAPLSSQTLQGLGGVSQYANAAQPYLGAAGQMTMGASGPVDPEQFKGMGSLQNYMNPYTKSVIDATQGEFNNQNQQQAQFLNSANISSGAFGGDRAGVGQSILANQQQLAEAPTIAGLNQANYNQAMSNWQNQQGVNLGAQQANAQRQMAGAAQLGQIGQSVQQAGLQGATANVAAGKVPQEEQQAIDTAAQNQYQTGQAYPFTTTGYLANIIEGLGSQSGGQSQTTSPGPNSITQGIGAATSAVGTLASLFGGSDARAKENIEEIGKTYDGQNIYRYNFKGDPRTQIGLMAQEEAYHDPGSVQRIGPGDMLGVNYKTATDDAAERGHFAMGGSPSMGASQATQLAAGMGGGGGGGPISPTQALMDMGAPGARTGLGSVGLLAGTDARPNPGFDTVPLRMSAQPVRQAFASGGGPQPLGPDGQFGYGTPGFDPKKDQLSSSAGVSEALWGMLSAGSDHPYTGIDTDQINAIAGGQWMPQRTGAKEPDYQNLQNSPQFGAAEASLAGLFGPSYTPGSTTPNKVAAADPAAATPSSSMTGPMTENVDDMRTYNDILSSHGGQNAAEASLASNHPGATRGGLSQGDLNAIFSKYFGSGGGQAGGSPMDANQGGGGGATVPPAGAATGRASGGRAGFQSGGGPDPNYSYYTPTTGNARGATYHAPQQVPPAIQIQRQLQGRARATAAVKHGLVRPHVIARDPVTGDHHDITPLHDRPPPPGGPLPASDQPTPAAFPGPPVRFGAKVPPEFFPPQPKDEGAPAPETDWESKPYGGRSTNYGPPRGAPAAEPPPPGIEGLPPPESPSEFFGRLPGRVFRGTGIGRAIDVGRRLLTADPTAGPTGVEAPRTLGRSPSGPSPTIHAGPPQSHVTDLGTWGGEGGAAEGRDFRGPPGQFDMPPPRWGGPPPADTDPDLMGWGDEGPQRYRGGRIGRQDGGGAETHMPYPGQQDPEGVWGPKPPPVSDGDDDFGGLSDADWTALVHGGDGPSAERAQINPSAVAQTGGFNGGGGGQPSFATTTSLMGGPPITALNLGHYVPTTGNARGATYVQDPGGGGVSPSARAQAPEHPAIRAARHIARQHAARRGGPGGVNLRNYAGIIGDHDMWPTPPTPSLGGASGSYQGGGGVMGSSPVMNAGAYVPQGSGMTGQTSQGGGLGSISTARSAAGGFGDLFGGGERAGFAEGGASDSGDPLLGAIRASYLTGQGGHGPPAPPEPAKAPAEGGQPDKGKGLGDSLKSLGNAAKGALSGQPDQSQPGQSMGMDGSSGDWGDVVNTDTMFSALPDDTFDLGGSDFFFATGGGVGLGALRGNFQEGGDADAEAIDAAVAGPAAAPVTAPAPGGGGGGAPVGGVPELINQNFGNRAGYASTISGRESGMGKSYVGDDSSSYGPFQLHYGGVSAKYPHPGLGDEFTRQTGLDARDPKTIPAQVKFVADYTAKHGWNDWSTAKQDNPGPAGANVPSAGAQPASASTTSYGGGFQLPGDGGPPPGQLDRHNLQAPTFGDELKHDPGGYLMSVGAAMMSSRSPWLGVGVGEGLVAGNKFLEQGRTLEKDWGLAQAQINNLSQEARLKGADIGLKTQQLDIARQMMKIRVQLLRSVGLDVDDGSGGAGAGATGGQGAGVGALPALPALGGGNAASGAPAGSGAAPAPAGGIGTSRDGAAAAPAGGGAGAPVVAGGAGGMPDLSKDPDYIKGQALIAQGNQKNAAGESVGMKDLGAAEIARGNALVEGAKSRFETQKAPIIKGQEEEAATNVKQTSEQDESVRQGLRANPVVAQRAEALMSILDSGYQPGAGADWKADVVRYIKSAGFNPAAIGLDPSTAHNYQEFMKNATNMVMESVKSMPGTPRVAEITAYTKASPNAELEPEANRAILAQALGVLDYQNQYAKGYLKWRHGEGAHPTTLSLGDFDDKYATDNKIEDAVARRRARAGIKPGSLPAGQYQYDRQSGRWKDKASGKVYEYDGTPLQGGG